MVICCIFEILFNRDFTCVLSSVGIFRVSLSTSYTLLVPLSAFVVADTITLYSI